MLQLRSDLGSRILRLLLVAKSPMPLADIASALDISESTAYDEITIVIPRNWDPPPVIVVGGSLLWKWRVSLQYRRGECRYRKAPDDVAKPIPEDKKVSTKWFVQR